MAEVRLERSEISTEVRARGLVAATLRFGPLLLELDDAQLEPESLPLPSPTGVTSIYDAARNEPAPPAPQTVWIPLVKRDRSDDPMTLGRALACDVILRAMSVSKSHATAQFEGDGVLVRDIGSTRGTFVDGKRLAPGESAMVLPGATFRLGKVTVKLVRLADVASG